MKIVNLTPHALNFVNDANESVVTIPPAGTVARCAVHREDVGQVAISVNEDDFERGDYTAIPIHRTAFGAVEGLPDPEPDTVYIVSSIVAQAVPDRSDVFAPDDFIRDEEGRTVGARALATMATSSDKINVQPAAEPLLEKFLKILDLAGAVEMNCPRDLGLSDPNKGCHYSEDDDCRACWQKALESLKEG